MPLYCIMLTGIKIDHRTGTPKVKVTPAGGPVMAASDAEANAGAEAFVRRLFPHADTVSREVARVPDHLIHEAALELGYTAPAPVSARKQRRRERETE